MLVHCVIYDDLRDLERMDIRINNGILDVCHLLDNEENYNELKKFANRPCQRRSALLSAH